MGKYNGSVYEVVDRLDVNFSFFTYANGHHREVIPLPENFNLARHKELYPPHEYGFPEGVIFRDYKAYCFLFLISSIPARNSDLIDDKGYTPIKIKKVADNIKDIKLYVDYLARTRVINIDRQYIVGQKARGYKWASSYANRPLVSQQVETKFADDVYNATEYVDPSDYPYIFHWYDEKLLTIDPLAEKYAYIVMQHKMNDKTRASWDWNSDLGKVKYPLTQYQAAIRNIGKIKFCEYEAHIDNNVHRLHSTLTNLQKEYRNFILYNNTHLSSVDVKNCQPYLTSLILNPEFWNPNSEIPLNIGHLPTNVQELFLSSNELMNAVSNFFSEVEQGAFETYKEMVSNGLIYEYILQLANDTIRDEGEPIIDRKEAKTMMFSLLFSKNGGRAKTRRIGKMKKLFNTRLFPQVGRLFQLLKEDYPDLASDKPHARLPILLQAIESEIILHRCCKKIWEESAGRVPIFTIHDSIASTPENIPYIEEVMYNELCTCVGIPPNCTIEGWKEENLDQDILQEIKFKLSTS